MGWNGVLVPKSPVEWSPYRKLVWVLNQIAVVLLPILELLGKLQYLVCLFV
jgi:hypothetical protein